MKKKIKSEIDNIGNSDIITYVYIPVAYLRYGTYPGRHIKGAPLKLILR